MNPSLNRRICLLAIPVILLFIVFLAWYNLPVVFEPPYLLALLNTAFIGIIPLVITYVTYRTYRQSGSYSVLLLGCGMLTVGLGSMAAGWLNGLPGGSNITPTLHNTAVLAGGLMIFAAIALAATGFPSRRGSAGAALPAACWGGIALATALLSLAAVSGLTPVFFVQEAGPTTIRQVVLTGALLLYMLSALLFFLVYRKRRDLFFFWFSMAFAYFAIGLFAIFLQPSVGSLIGWAGRIAQYAGMCFAVGAVLDLQDRTSREGTGFYDQITRFFSSDAATEAVLSSIDDAIWLFAPDRTCITANPAGVRRLHAERVEDLIGRRANDCFSPEIVAARDARFAEVLRTRMPVRFEDERDGQVFDNRFFPVLEGDEIASVLVISREITSRRQAEAFLKKSEERLSLSLAASGQAVWDYDAVTDTVIASDRMLEIYGIPEDHTLRTMDDWHTMILPDDVGEISRNIDRADPGSGVFHTEYRIRRGTDGQVRWIASDGKIIRDAEGRELRRIGILSDVTEEKEARVALAKSRAQLAEIVNSIQDNFFVIDRDWNIVFANRKFASYAGRDPAEIIGKCIWDVYPEHKGTIVEEKFRTVMDTREVLHYEVHGKYSDAWYTSVIYPSEEGITILGTDITEQKKAEEALKKSEERLSLSLAAGGQAPFEVDLRTDTITVSDRLREIFGIPAGHSLRTQHDWMGMILEEDIPFLRNAVLGAARICGTFHADFRIRRGTDGNIRWIASHGKIIPDADGRPARYVGIVSDITDRKKAEEDLRDSEERLSAVLRSSLDAISVRDLATNRYTLWSPSVTRLTGFTQEEMNEMGYENAVGRLHPEDRDTYLRYAGEVIAGKTMPAPVEYRWRVKSGQYHWFGDSQNLIRDDQGSPVSLLRISRDINDRKIAEAALRESEERYRLVADFTNDWVFWIDEKGTILYTSPPAEKILGRPTTGFIRIQDLIAEVVHPNDQARWLEHIHEERRHAESGEMEFRIVRPDGEIRWIHHTCRPVIDERGRSLGIRGSNRDITDRKTAEEALLASLAEKETLIREVHHRVKNNLQVISGLLDMTRIRTPDESTANVLTDLMLKIQTMAQIHTHLYKGQEYGKVDMEAQVREQVAAMSTIYGDRSRPIGCTIAGSRIFLPVDQAIPAALVINEVLSNAFKHAFRGRGEGEITVTLVQKDGRVRITIRDNGIGMPEGFEISRSNSLGMKLIRTLMQHQLNGMLVVTSRNGTEVIAEFPVRTKEE